MKILKWIGIIILIIITLLLITPLFLPSTFHVERSTVVEKPIDIVFQTAINMNQRAKWDPWIAMEPNAEINVQIEPGLIGSGYSWKGEIIGEGKITINEFIPNQLIKSKIVFISPQNMESDVIWNFVESDEGTKITWAFEGTLSYPIEKWFGLFMDKSLGSQFETGLSNFKSLVESLPDLKGRSGEIKEIDFEGFIALTVIDKIKQSKLEFKMLDIYSTLMVFIKSNDLEIAGSPFRIYHDLQTKDDSIIIELGFPINKEIIGTDNINCIKISPCKTVTALHFGHFFTVKTTYDALHKYIDEQNQELNGTAWEMYITDPFKEPDQAKWETQIYIPVK